MLSLSCKHKGLCGIYLFGKIRRTDWRPVRPYGDEDMDENYRGPESESDNDSGSEEDAYGERIGYSDNSDSASEDSYRENDIDYEDEHFESYLAKRAGPIAPSEDLSGLFVA